MYFTYKIIRRFYEIIFIIVSLLLILTCRNFEVFAQNYHSIYNDSLFLGINICDPSLPEAPLQIYGWDEAIFSLDDPVESLIKFSILSQNLDTNIYQTGRCDSLINNVNAIITLKNTVNLDTYKTLNWRSRVAQQNDLLIQTEHTAGHIVLSTKNPESDIKFATTVEPPEGILGKDILRMIINSGGDVGINVLEPSARLDVNGSIRFRDINPTIGLKYLTIDPSGYLGVGDGDIPPNSLWSLSGNIIDSNSFFGSINNLPLVIKTNNEERLIISENGSLTLSMYDSVFSSEFKSYFFRNNLISTSYRVFDSLFQINGIDLALSHNEQATEISNSLIFGINCGTTANGRSIFAGGINSVANGSNSFSFGANVSSSDGGVVLGANSSAYAHSSFAFGSGVAANHSGSFIFGDSNYSSSIVNGNLIPEFSSTTVNQFSTRFAGDATLDQLYPGGDYASYRFYTNDSTTLGSYLRPSMSGWNNFSDANMKENFEEIDFIELLNKIRYLDVSTWNYIDGSDEIRYMGPMSQDFHDAFKLGGNDNKSINTINIDGVNLSGIKGLIQEIDFLKKRITDLEEQLSYNKSPLTTKEIKTENIILEQNRPNPFSDYTIISGFISDNSSNIYYFEITDLNGQRIYSQKVNANTAFEIEFSSIGINTGIYNYAITDGKQVLIQRKMLISK